MRSISVGAMLYVLLIVAVFLWGPLSQAAVANSGVTIGFSIDGSGLVASSAEGEEIGRYLGNKLSIPVKVRSFAAEDQLFNWLTRFNEVDFAWLSEDFLEGVTVGQLYLLAKNLDHAPGLLRGEVVARQGMNDVLRQQVQAAFIGMYEDPTGQVLLSKLGVSRFVSPSPWKTPEWKAVATPQLATGPSHEPDENSGKTSEWKVASTVPPVSDPSAVREEDSSLSATAAAGQVFTAPPQETVEMEESRSQETLSPVESPVLEPTPVQPEDKALETPVATLETTAPAQIDDLVAEPPPGGSNEESAEASAPVAPEEAGQQESIALVADYLAYNSEEDSYEAKGDVILRKPGVELKSGELLWQAVTQDAAAQGAVHLNEDDTEVFGERLQYNMATGQGQIHGGRVFVREGNFHLAGEQIEKRGENEYFVNNGSFTTCDGEIPDWKFSASEVDVTLGGYASAKNVWFHVKDIPVLYSPYLSFPVKTERDSGFLTPSFGYSNNKGTRASVAWYQVIDRHMDATVYLDYLSDIGLGKGLEYRYALSNQNNGRALYYHVTGTGEVDGEEDKEDFPDVDYYLWEHRGELPGNWQLTADIEYTDSKLFFEEFGDVAEDYERDKTVSTLMLRRNWQKLNLTGFARYIRDLETDNDETLQKLPELGLGLSRYRLGDTPFYVGLESYATRFWRDKGNDGERLYLRPSLSAVLKPGSWLEVTPEVALYERLYNTDSTDEDDFIPEFSLALSTRLVKSFDATLWGADRIQHSIEPAVTYTYVPDEPQGDLPLFDLNDRILSRNDVVYSLINRLTARDLAEDGSRSYRELFYLRLSQRYDVDEARNDRSGENEPFSDVRVEMDFNPTRNVSFDAESLIPVYGDSGFNRLSVGSTIRDDAGNAVDIDYVYRDIDFFAVATDYIKVQMDTSILKPVYVRYEERYDFQEHRELEKVVGVEYRAKCWSVMLTYRDRYRENGDNDQEFMFSFVLAGLGASQGFGNTLGARPK